MPIVEDTELNKLIDKTIVQVEHFHYGSVYLIADDGTKVELRSYGHIYAEDKTR